MKKVTYLVLCLALSPWATGQQTVVDFENLSLPTAESYYDGADSAGGFTSQNVFFANDYQGYWAGGFAYSNMTDVTTPGWLNTYSVFAGAGADNSANYALFSYVGKLTFSQSVTLDSIKICNSTYAALSMKNGDLFGKQFGSVNNASGMPDGTNGEDFFLLRIYALDELDVKIDSLDFYLADYRFSDNGLDYIVENWTNVDLSSLAPAKSLSFNLSSSDNGAFGMNTPNYFALDNLSFKSGLGIGELQVNDLQSYPNPVQDLLTIKWNGQAEYALYDFTGKLIKSGRHHNLSQFSTSDLSSGVYELKLYSQGQILSQKIVK